VLRSYAYMSALQQYNIRVLLRRCQGCVCIWQDCMLKSAVLSIHLLRSTPWQHCVLTDFACGCVAVNVPHCCVQMSLEEGRC
jgi:hypothetical protein